MKHQTILWIFLALTALLSACAKAETPYTVEDAQALLDSGAFDGELAEVTGPMIPLLYGVENEELVAYVSCRAVNTAVSMDEVTVLILSDEKAAEKAEGACRRHIASELENARAYTPAAIPALEAAVVSRIGCTVLVAVGNPDKLPEAIRELGK